MRALIYKICKYSNEGFVLYPVTQNLKHYDKYSLITCTNLAFFVPADMLGEDYMSDSELLYCRGKVEYDPVEPLYDIYPSLAIIPRDKINPMMYHKRVESVQIWNLSPHIQEMRQWYNQHLMDAD